MRASIEDKVLSRGRLLKPDRLTKLSGNVGRHGCGRPEDLGRDRIKDSET
jgi:hypothetical protein